MSTITRASCLALDRADELAGFRARFALPEDRIYLDGNSLGAMPRVASELAQDVVARQWGDGLVGSWNEAGWWQLPKRLGDKLAGLVGADPGEVLVTDATGINLFKAVAAALSLRPERRVVVMEGSNFPTDNYVVQGLLETLGRDYEIRFTEEEGLDAAIDDDVAVVCLTQVHYRSGRLLDMRAVTAAAHAAGALTVWDLSHSTGAVVVDLNACEADFAVGCTYKYLNGGPGSPGYLFAARRHQAGSGVPLRGWWGHEAPFDFVRDFRPAAGVARFATGTQPIVSLALAEPGIDLALEMTPTQLRRKSLSLTSLFIELVEGRCDGLGLELVTPRAPARRGSQVALRHPQAYAVMQALIEKGVVGDFRAPDILRFGFAAPYNSHLEVWDAVDRLQSLLRSEDWRAARYARRNPVT